MHVKLETTRLTVAILTVAILGISPPAAATEYELKPVLKEMDRAVKGQRWLTASAKWDERLEARSLVGAGEVWIDLAGRLRAEVAGDSPRTILITPPHIHVYRPDEKTAHTYSTVFQPDQIVQHVLVGFTPTGSALKKKFKVKILRQDDLDGRATLLLTLEPKAKDLAAIVDFIQLWVDTDSWLPAQIRLRHKTTRIEATVQWLTLTPEAELANSLFTPAWPVGTQLIKPQFAP